MIRPLSSRLSSLLPVQYATAAVGDSACSLIGSEAACSERPCSLSEQRGRQEGTSTSQPAGLIDPTGHRARRRGMSEPCGWGRHPWLEHPPLVSTAAPAAAASATAAAPAAGAASMQLRCYNTWQYPKRSFPMPPAIKAIVDEKLSQRRVIPEFTPPPPVPGEMTARSRRVGCIAVKAGMTQTWDEKGARVPLTVLLVDECQVVGVKSPERNGYWALQVGAGYRKQKAIDFSAAGLYLKQGVPFKHELAEFMVSEDALLPVGTHITAAHFVAGQHVDVQGITKGKGFQGVMKRWGFKGMPASHGVSLSHRAPGSIGCRQDPGKVWKGKKLPGWMGEDWRTVHNCLLYKVEPQRNLLFVRGQVPGPAGQFVYLRDSICMPKDKKAEWGLPFPTFLGDPSALPATVYKNPADPYRAYVEESDYFPIEWKKGE